MQRPLNRKVRSLVIAMVRRKRLQLVIHALLGSGGLASYKLVLLVNSYYKPYQQNFHHALHGVT